MAFKKYTFIGNDDKFYRKPGNIVFLYIPVDLYWINKDKGLMKNNKLVSSINDFQKPSIPKFVSDNIRNDKASHTDIFFILKHTQPTLFKTKLVSIDDFTKTISGRIFKKDIAIWGYNKSSSSNSLLEKKFRKNVEKAVDLIYKYIIK